MGKAYRFFVVVAVVFLRGLPLFADVCPDGYTAYLGPMSNRVRDVNGECSELCGAGFTRLNTSNGYHFNLFASKNTTPAINVKVDGTICYADLVAGAGSGTLNVKLGDAAYHANIGGGELCPVTYDLSYSCGDGATGVPPDSIEIAYGDLYTGPHDSGTCYRAGYSITSWKIDTSTVATGQYYNYTAQVDKTMVAQWSPNQYVAPYLCNYCVDSTVPGSDYVISTFGSSFTTATALSCLNPFNQTLKYYQVLDVWGNDTGDIVAPGATMVWGWPYSMRLRAIWSEPNPVGEPTKYTLSYSCGDGATGVPPDSIEIAYGDLYTGPHDSGTCYRAGYSITSWKIDTSTVVTGQYYNYTAQVDKTMVAQWSPNQYVALYLCNNGIIDDDYIFAKYGDMVTPSTTVCAVDDGAIFAGYKVLDAWGNDTGDIVAPGATMVWGWPYNIRLLAIWE